MRFEGIVKSHLILRLVQVGICLFMVNVFHNIGQIDRLWQYKDDKFFKENPGKPVLFLSLNKPEYRIGEPVIYQDILLNDGETDIVFPVNIWDGNHGEEIYLQTFVALTNEKGETLHFTPFPLNANFFPYPIAIMTIKPHNMVPCFDCSHDLLEYVYSWGFSAAPVSFKDALKKNGVYYLQTIYSYSGNGEGRRTIYDYGVTHDSPPRPDLWNGVLLSNRVKFEIKP